MNMHAYGRHEQVVVEMVVLGGGLSLAYMTSYGSTGPQPQQYVPAVMKDACKPLALSPEHINTPMRVV
jgi:hypothetical protein